MKAGRRPAPLKKDFHFLFGYDPVYWRGLRKHGFIDKHAGVRLIQCLYTPRLRCFNQFAAPGGWLHDEVWKERRAFLIDRGMGGVAYENYAFDKRLLDSYARRLGDRFLGIQFHEWVCNVGNEWARFREQFLEGDEKVAIKAIEEHFTYRSVATALETGDPRDFAGKTFPMTTTQFAKYCRETQERKLADFGGHLTNVASAGMCHWQALRWGAKVVMPEHGHHIPMGRVHTATARGAVRQEGRSDFGSYYAPWGNSPDSVTCYMPFSLWYVPSELLCGDAFAHGGNGGSSRAFQRRLFHWAYLTGARFMAEEWGPENTFYDWKDYDLTPYGEVVRDFLAFVRKVGRGEPVVKTAIVIDREWFGLDTYHLAGAKEYLRFFDAPEHQKRVAEFFRALVGHHDSPGGDDARVLTASAMPDALNVVLDDAKADFYEGYEVVAYIGERPGRFLKKMKGSSCETILLGDPGATAEAVTRATLARMPVRVDGRVNWLVNRKPGVWQVALFNPEGVTVSFDKGERVDASATVTAVVNREEALSRPAVKAAWPGRSGTVRSGARGTEVTVGPGGLVVLEFAAQ